MGSMSSPAPAAFRWRTIAVPVLLPTAMFGLGEGAILPVIPTLADDLGLCAALFALFRLRSLDPRCRRHRRHDRFRIADDLDTRRDREVADMKHVAGLEARDIHRDAVRDGVGECADRDLVNRLAENATVAHADGDAVENERNVRLHGNLEVDLLEVDVQKLHTNGAELPILEKSRDRVVTVDADLEHRRLAVLTVNGAHQLTRGHRE